MKGTDRVLHGVTPITSDFGYLRRVTGNRHRAGTCKMPGTVATDFHARHFSMDSRKSMFGYISIQFGGNWKIDVGRLSAFFSLARRMLLVHRQRPRLARSRCNTLGETQNFFLQLWVLFGFFFLLNSAKIRGERIKKQRRSTVSRTFDTVTYRDF